MVITDIKLDSFIEAGKLCKVPVVVVCKNTSDYPGKYVARLWNINNKPTKYIMIKDDIENIRNNIPPWMTRMERSHGDDFVIVESWF